MLLMLKLRAQCLLATRDEMFAFLGKVSPAAAGQPCLPAFCPGGRWSVMPANEGKQETHRSLSFASSPSFPDKMSLNRMIQTKNWIRIVYCEFCLSRPPEPPEPPEPPGPP